MRGLFDPAALVVFYYPRETRRYVQIMQCEISVSPRLRTLCFCYPSITYSPASTASGDGKRFYSKKRVHAMTLGGVVLAGYENSYASGGASQSGGKRDLTSVEVGDNVSATFDGCCSVETVLIHP